LMISPNLHDIWAMFFLILSRYEKLVLLILMYLGLQVMAIHCRAAKNSLRGTVRIRIRSTRSMINNPVIFPRA
jgi:hypothetical protein